MPPSAPTADPVSNQDTTPDGDSPTAQRRKGEIARAARAELLEKGFEGLRMRAVADRCGINVATLDYHAGGKDGLIALVAQSLAADFQTQRLATNRARMTGIEELVQELHDFRQVRREHPDIHPIMSTLSRRAPNDPKIAQHILPMKARLHEKITAIFAKGVADGSLRPDLDPDTSARLYVWMILSLGSPEQAHLDFSRHATEILTLFAAGPVDRYEGSLS